MEQIAVVLKLDLFELENWYDLKNRSLGTGILFH